MGSEYVYEMRIKQSTTKQIKVTLDRPIEEKDLWSWAEDSIDELGDIERYHHDVKLDPEDLVEGETVPMIARLIEEDEFLEFEGVYRVSD